MPDADASSLPDSIGPYRIERRVGAGAMGEVFLGVDTAGQRAAVKLMSARLGDTADFVERFEREIQVVATIKHPAIAQALGWGDHRGQAYLAMEFVPGPSLDQVLKKTGPLAEGSALRVVLQVARGLEHAYLTAGLIHRDIKPANILIRKAGEDPFATAAVDDGDQPKLIDFGLAKSVSSQNAHALTMTGAVMGTPHYMSPEQIRGEKAVDLHADIYALGATLYHLLTGSYPYPEPSPGLVMTSHLTKAVPDPGSTVRGLSRQTRDLVTQAMAKKPGDRHLTWRAFIVAVEAAIKSAGGSAVLRRPSEAAARAPVRTTRVGSESRKPAESRPQPGTEPTARHLSAGAPTVIQNQQPATARIPTQAPTARVTRGANATPLHASAVMREPATTARARRSGVTEHIHWIILGIAVLVVVAVVVITVRGA
jgi:eukaryotic-like serine/threonine-protein kinase